MSYDIFAFDPTKAPGDDGELMSWYEKQAEWSEPHSYDDDSVTTPALRAFYRDMIRTFPPMNGPQAIDSDDADTDYSIGYGIIYVAFRWARADDALSKFLSLGVRHKVGVCEVSESPVVIYRPDVLR
ncbi:Uncharacterised protein [Mycobacteroides abscessus subsp. bolletii]|nr:Uncharacterised protein [Mycobacteroides abscessus subsp. bolletii]SHY66020.1 Uncharacterised protein [Mycobacteroides abscessus subsp. bolletii]